MICDWAGMSHLSDPIRGICFDLCETCPGSPEQEVARQRKVFIVVISEG